MPSLSETEVTARLASIPDWHLEAGALVRNFTFTDFREAMSFVNAVAALAERVDHHPDIDIRYNKVKLALSSHDAGGITNRDFSLAVEIASVL